MALLLLFALAGALTLPTAAHGAPVPQVNEPGFWESLSPNTRKAIVNSLARQRGDQAYWYPRTAGTPPSWYVEGASDAIKSSTQLVQRTHENGSQISRGLWRTLTKAGIYKNPGLMLRQGLLSKVVMRGAGAGLAVGVLYEIGTGIYKQFSDAELPKTGTLTGVDWIYPGTARCPAYGTFGEQVWSGSCPTQPLLAATWLHGEVIYDLNGTEKKTRSIDCRNPVDGHLGGGVIEVGGSQSFDCQDGAGFIPRAMVAVGLPLPTDGGDALLPDTPPRSIPGPGYTGSEGLNNGRTQIPHETQNPANRPTQEQAIEDALEAAENAALREYIKWVLRQLELAGQGEDDPEPQAVYVPSPGDATSPASGALPLVMPGCHGQSFSECRLTLEARGWDGALEVGQVRTFETGDPFLPANSVVEQYPPANVEIDANATVTVDLNPGVEDMPAIVPTPQPGEHYQTYVQRLTDAGLLGQVQILTDATLDPTAGPNAVVRVAPDPGTRVRAGTEVLVTANPQTAPQPAPVDPVTGEPVPPGTPGGSVGCNAWVTPALNLTPLREVPIGEVFPFALPFWIGEALDQWVGTAVTPEWTFVFPFAGEFTIDLHLFDSIMPAIRAVLLVLSVASMLWLFASFAFGSVGGPRGGDD